MELIPKHLADEVRNPPFGFSPQAGCGDVEKRSATGRSSCREYGRKIAKGSIELVTVYDFHGGGLAGDPWTGVETHIHEKCP